MEHQGQSLDSLLNDEPQDAVEAPEVETVPEPTEHAETPSEGPLRGPDGKFASKQDTTGVEDAVPPTDKLPKEDYKAIREEREKRQALERELEALRQQITQPQEPPAPPPSVWEDENAYGGHLVSTAVQQATFNAKLDMSEMMARQAHPDFEDMKAAFVELMTQNPVLQQQALADPHPWNKAYEIAKNHKAMQELGATNLDELRAKVREELMAEMGASAQPQVQVPPTLSTERNVGARTGPEWTGPKSLDQLLG